MWPGISLACPPTPFDHRLGDWDLFSEPSFPGVVAQDDVMGRGWLAVQGI